MQHLTVEQLGVTPVRIPGARRLFAAAQHQIDHLLSTPTAEIAPELAFDWAWDVVLQLGRDLDRLAAKLDRVIYLQPHETETD